MRILYLDLDTLRPDHLGCYGYMRNTSPNLDRIAAEGARFENCCTPDAPCLPSRMSLMTGMFGIHHGCVNHNGNTANLRRLGSDRLETNPRADSMLPSFLRHHAGLYTAYIGGFPDRHAIFEYCEGFREVIDTGKRGNESAEEVTPTVMKWIENHGAEDNWYLHVNYWDAHGPYRVPADFGNPFENEPYPNWLDGAKIKEQREKSSGPHGTFDLNMYSNQPWPDCPRYPHTIRNEEDVKQAIDGYDCGVNYMDSHIGMLLAEFEKLGVLDDMVIIVSSDHGENLGELGMWCEHGTADYITCRIPLLIRFPGKIKPGLVDRGLHYNLDLLPTLADLLGVARRPFWEGESFAAAMTGGQDCGRNELILSQCTHGCQRAVLWDQWLYIRTYHDFYHLYPAEMLFNLAEDPHEEHNLAKSHPEIVREGGYRYLNWLDSMMKTQPRGFYHDPLWQVLDDGGPCYSRGYLPEYCKHLEETGREWAVPLLKARHPKEFEVRTSKLPCPDAICRHEK